MASSNGLTMSLREMDAFGRFVEALFPVEEDASIEAWGTGVAQAYAELLGARGGMTLLPADDGQFTARWRVDPEAWVDYEHNYVEVDEALPVMRSSRATVWCTHTVLKTADMSYEEYPRTASYEWANRYDHNWGVATLDAPPAPFYVGVFAYKGSAHSDFGSPRDLAMARLCQRPFQAAVRALNLLKDRHRQLARLVDSMDAGVQLCDEHGHALHINPALRSILEEEPDKDTLQRAIVRLVKAVAGRVAGELSTPVGAPQLVRIHTDTGDYELWGAPVSGARPGETPMIMVGVRSLRPRVMTVRELAEVYDLTPRESQVAALLSEGASNIRIVRELDVRPSTARRHTEAVLRKLNVRSRAEVPSKVLRSRSANRPPHAF